MKNLKKTKTIIGWEITQDLQVETMKIDQKNYIQDLLESKKMSLCYLTVLSMKASLFFTLDQAGNHLLIDLIAYQRMIRKLIYLACGTRPDIVFL